MKVDKGTQVITVLNGKNALMYGQSADEYLIPAMQGKSIISETERQWV